MLRTLSEAIKGEDIYEKVTKTQPPVTLYSYDSGTAASRYYKKGGRGSSTAFPCPTL